VNVKVLYKTTNKIVSPKKGGVGDYRSFCTDETSLIPANLSVYPHACKSVEGVNKRSNSVRIWN
jgi:hypothetical protein